jgi:hypothetical protein
MPDETAPAAEEREFLRWFAERGAVLSPSVALASFAGMGRGMQALEALPEDALLFAVPRAMLLGTRTSALPRLALAEDARRRGDGMDIDDDEAQPGTWQHLHRQGWAQLLLVMLWERFRASERGQAACAAFDAGADWGAYFGILPKHFDTPMFWSDAELAELKGTAIVGELPRHTRIWHLLTLRSQRRSARKRRTRRTRRTSFHTSSRTPPSSSARWRRSSLTLCLRCCRSSTASRCST